VHNVTCEYTVGNYPLCFLSVLLFVLGLLALST